jgi:predicted nucleotidyltransferase
MRQPADREQSELDEILGRVRAALGAIPGVAALTLGGSWARGTASANSDIDIGLYYEPDRRPDFDELYRAIARLDDRGDPDGHGRYGEWGPWINGGVWLRIDGHKTDILLRDLRRVEQVLRDCAAGVVAIHYQPGHPHGFSTAIYAGEVYHAIAFHDPDGTIADLRSLVDPYPEPLAAALIRTFGWEVGFALETAASAARRGDAAYVCGCAFRAIACLNQVLFAAERRYLTNEKGAVAIADRFPTAPSRYAERVAAAITKLSGAPEDLTAALGMLRTLHDEVLAVGAETPSAI